MFIPPSRLHSRRGTKPLPRTKVAAVLVAVLSTLVGGIVTSLVGRGRGGDSGDLTVAGIGLAAVAVVAGFVLARAIGRQGRIGGK